MTAALHGLRAERLLVRAVLAAGEPRHVEAELDRRAETLMLRRILLGEKASQVPPVAAAPQRMIHAA